MYLNADLLGINCVTGMSCLFRKKVVDKVGGLRSLSQFLAEDYHLGQAVLKQYVCQNILPHMFCVLFFFEGAGR
jgi:ceramide glucosyltransferase